MSSDEGSTREMKTALGEVRSVVEDVKDGLRETGDAARDVAATVRVKPVRRLIRRRVLGQRS